MFRSGRQEDGEGHVTGTRGGGVLEAFLQAPVAGNRRELHQLRCGRHIADHSAEAGARVERVDRGEDPLDAIHGVRNERIDGELRVHHAPHELGHGGARLPATEGRSLPRAAGDQLEGPSGDLVASSGDADDTGHAPATMGGFESRAHHLRVARAVKGVVDAPLGAFEERLHDAANAPGVDALRRAEGPGGGELGLIRVWPHQEGRACGSCAEGGGVLQAGGKGCWSAVSGSCAQVASLCSPAAHRLRTPPWHRSAPPPG